MPTPTPTPTPTNPNIPNNPSPNPLPPVPLDPRGTPVIPQTPLVMAPHVIFNNGATSYYTGFSTISSAICQDRNVAAYYVPCANSKALYCWGSTTKCGYYKCVRFGW
jgi:hypothetical protein